MEVNTATIDLTSTYEEMLKKIHLTPEDFILNKSKKAKTKELAWNPITLSPKPPKVAKVDDIVLTPLFTPTIELSDDEDEICIKVPDNEVIELLDSDEESDIVQKEPDKSSDEPNKEEVYEEVLYDVEFEIDDPELQDEEIVSLTVLENEISEPADDTVAPVEELKNSAPREADELSGTTENSTADSLDSVVTVIETTGNGDVIDTEELQESQEAHELSMEGSDDSMSLFIDETSKEEPTLEAEKSEVLSILDTLSESNNIEIVLDDEPSRNDTDELDNLNKTSYSKASSKAKNKKSTVQSEDTVNDFNQETALVAGTEYSEEDFENHEDNSFSFIIQKVESIHEDHNHNANAVSEVAESVNYTHTELPDTVKHSEHRSRKTDLIRDGVQLFNKKHRNMKNASKSRADGIQTTKDRTKSILSCESDKFDDDSLENAKDTPKSQNNCFDDIQRKNSTRQDDSQESIMEAAKILDKNIHTTSEVTDVVAVSDEDVDKLAKAAHSHDEHNYSSGSDIAKHTQSEQEFPVIEGIASSPEIEEEIIQDDLMDAEVNEKYMEDIRNKVKAQVQLLRNKSLKKNDETDEKASKPPLKPTGYLRVKSRQSLFPCLTEDKSNLSMIADIPEPVKKVVEGLPSKPQFVSYDDKGGFLSQNPSASETPGVENEIRQFLKRPRQILLKPYGKIIKPKPILVTSVKVPVASEEDRLKERTESIRNILNESVNGNPFQSNSLDEFLSQATLNISYDIPKNGAEDGLTKDYSTVEVVPVRKKIEKEETTKTTVAPAYKPKTLAEKRKILEKNMRKNRNIEKSFIMYKDKKIFVKAATKDKCYAFIDCTRPPPPPPEVAEEISPRKRSLLTELYEKEKSPLKYKPGPMSKKHTLQVENEEWVTQVKTLPKVVLSVMPEFGKPVHKALISIVNNNWNEHITEDRLEFALSALKTTDRLQVFKFPVNYENEQKTILVRRKMSEKYILRQSFHPIKDEDDDKIISDVMGKLLNYVEIKEISESLLKYDDVQPEDEVFPNEPVLDKPKPKSSSLKRTSRELLRLNCKVISMEAEETERKINCKRPYCKLGCICRSLKCKPIIRGHCSNIRCVFNCTCPKEKVNKIISLVGSDLSSDTVSRIEDEAKKNLAKEEKEFTQTIIYANNKAIVVPTANQTRRAARIPKKYCYDDDEDLEKTRRRMKKTNKPCCVLLERLDLKELVSLCLTHKLYDCHCEGLSPYPAPPTKRLSNSSENSDLKPRKIIKIGSNDDNDYKPRSSKIMSSVSSDDSNDTFTSSSGRVIRKKPSFKPDFVYTDVDDSEITEDYCARTIPVEQKNPATIDATKADFENIYNEADKLRLQMKSDLLMTECDRLKHDIIINYEAEHNNEKKKNSSIGVVRIKPHMKKMVKVMKNPPQVEKVERYQKLVDPSEPKCKKVKLMAVTDVPAWLKEKMRIEGAITTASPKVNKVGDLQRIHSRKQLLKVRSDDSNVAMSVSPSPKCPATITSVPMNKVFEGEILVSEANTELFTRVLPWTSLLEGYINKTIKVFLFRDKRIRLMLSTNPTSPLDGFLDIETDYEKILEMPAMNPTTKTKQQVEMVKDLIGWLQRGRLPAKYQVYNLALGLQEMNKDQFEVRGICSQNTQFGLQHKREKLGMEISVSMHKHIDDKVKMLQCQKGYLTMKRLSSDIPNTLRIDTWAQVPYIADSKWRQIFLFQDFVYLYFLEADFSISYDKLNALLRTARNKNVTIRAFSREIEEIYKMEKFGVYATPKHGDRIFVGPYPADYDDADVGTLVKMNNTFVCRERMNLNGKDPQQCGQWLRQLGYNEQKRKVVKINGVTVTIKECQPRDPSDFNRFLITNIPKFGYLGAVYHEESAKIEVSWPFENKVLQFDSVEDSKKIVSLRLHRLILTVPETFVIKVQVVDKLNLNNFKPVDHKWLNGQYVCGCFGIVHYKFLNNDVCAKLHVSRESIMERIASKIRDSFRATCIEAANVLGVSAEQARTLSVNDLFAKMNTAKAEVCGAHETLMGEISRLQRKRKGILEKLKGMISDLNPKLRKREEIILDEIMKEERVAEIWEKQSTTSESSSDMVSSNGLESFEISMDLDEPAINERKRKRSFNEETAEESIEEVYPETLPFVITTVETVVEEDE